MSGASIGMTWRDPFYYCVLGAIASTAWLAYLIRGLWTERRPLPTGAGWMLLLQFLFGTSWGSLAGLAVKALS